MFDVFASDGGKAALEAIIPEAAVDAWLRRLLLRALGEVQLRKALAKVGEQGRRLHA